MRHLAARGSNQRLKTHLQQSLLLNKSAFFDLSTASAALARMMLPRQRTAPPNEQRDASVMTATRQHTELHASMLLLAAGQKLLRIDAVPVSQPPEPRSLRSRNHLRRIFKRPAMARKQPPEVVPRPYAVPKLPLMRATACM
jgi:hypothetical protein